MARQHEEARPYRFRTVCLPTDTSGNVANACDIQRPSDSPEDVEIPCIFRAIELDQADALNVRTSAKRQALLDDGANRLTAA